MNFFLQKNIFGMDKFSANQYKYFGTKPIQIEAHPTIASSKLCEFICVISTGAKCYKARTELSLYKLSSLIVNKSILWSLSSWNWQTVRNPVALLLKRIIVQDRKSVRQQSVLWADLQNTSLVCWDLSDILLPHSWNTSRHPTFNQKLTTTHICGF